MARPGDLAPDLGTGISKGRRRRAGAPPATEELGRRSDTCRRHAAAIPKRSRARAEEVARPTAAAMPSRARRAPERAAPIWRPSARPVAAPRPGPTSHAVNVALNRLRHTPPGLGGGTLMLTIYTCLVDEHDWQLVAAAVAICALGCLVSAALWEKLDRRRQGRRAVWIGLAALTAASSVWATHFVAMLAHEVRLERGLSLPLTALSFALTVLLMVPASLALGRARRDPRWAVPAGAAFAFAVASMHYTGMAAYRSGAWMQWDPRFVAASLAAGAALFIAAASAFALARARHARLMAPLLLALGIATLHFTGMSAVTITPFPDPSDGDAGLNGAWLPAATIGAVIVVMGGAAAALWQDRVELRRSAREMRAARDHAEAATQAKSLFLAKMSHELRTPLNGIIGLSQALRDTPLHDTQTELLDTIIASGDALVAIVDDILDAARIDAKQIVLDPIPFDLATLVNDVARLMAGQARAKVLGLDAAISPDLPARVIGDATRVRQILLEPRGQRDQVHRVRPGASRGRDRIGGERRRLHRQRQRHRHRSRSAGPDSSRPSCRPTN